MDDHASRKNGAVSHSITTARRDDAIDGRPATPPPVMDLSELREAFDETTATTDPPRLRVVGPGAPMRRLPRALRQRAGRVRLEPPPAAADDQLTPVWRGSDRRGRSAWPTVSVVIPAKNEARNVVHVLEGLPATVDEVVLVDGNSTDGTIDAALRARPDTVVVRQAGRGKGNALASGFAVCTGEVIVALDADGSTDPSEIPIYVGALLAGADFVKGSRHAVGGGSVDFTRVRRLGDRGLSAIVNTLYRTRHTDVTYGYNAFWRECLPMLDVDCGGFEAETLMIVRAARAGLRVSEVPSFEQRRLHGESNLRAVRDGMRILRMLLRERRAASAAGLGRDGGREGRR